MRTSLFLITVLTLSACTQQQPESPLAAPLPMVAPSTAWVASRQTPINASQVLVGPEADLFTSRDEKFAYGPYPLGSITTYSTYTYDAQPISTFNGYGYRYRWVVQNGISFPLDP